MSTEKQLKGGSLQRQLRRSQDFCERNGLTLVDDYRDIGVSGLRGKHRTKGSLARFLEALEAKPRQIPFGSYLLIEDIDRLSRESLLEAFPTFASILKAGITIVTLGNGKVLTEEAVRKDPGLIREIIGGMERAHAEPVRKGEMIKEAWVRARMDAQAGRLIMTTWCPKWLRVVKDANDETKRRFEVIEERALIVRRIFEMAASGLGRYSIVRILNQDGVPTFSGAAAWRLVAVERILNRKHAIGLHEPGRYNDKHVWARAGEPFPYYPAIIDVDLGTERSPQRAGPEMAVGAVGFSGTCFKRWRDAPTVAAR